MRFKKLFFAMVVSLFLFGLQFTCFAEEEGEAGEEQIQPYKLEQVIVRDHPLRGQALEITPDVTVINVDDFEKAGRMNDIQDLLEETLGLDVMRSNIGSSPSDQVYLRGMDASRYQIFMDGRPMRLMGRMGYYKVDWTTMPLNNVESVEIIRGSHSLLFPFSMGGAFNIITKKGKKTDEIKPDVTVASEFGSYGQESYSANVQGGALNAIGYSFAAETREGDGYLRNNFYDTDNFNSRISLFLPTDGTLTAGFDYVDNRTGYAVINDPDDPASDYDPDYPVVSADEIDKYTHDYEGKAYPGGDSYWDKRTYDYSLMLEQPMGPGEIRAQAFHNHSDRDRLYHDKEKQNEQIGTEEFNTGYSLDYLGVDIFDKHTLSFGGEYRTQGPKDTKDFYEIVSAYVQDVWNPVSPLTLTWGVRFYEFQSDAYKPFPDGKKFVLMSPEEREKYGYRRVENEWCPKARLSYEVDPDLTLYASASREMRLP